MENYSIKGQTVLITGASSGIGKGSVMRFAAMGVNLVITAQRLDHLLELATARKP